MEGWPALTYRSCRSPGATNAVNSVTNRSALNAARAVPDSMHDGRGIEPVGPGRVKRALHDACQHGGRHAVPGHVGDEQRGLSRLSRRVVVQVASDACARRVSAADREPVDNCLAARAAGSAGTRAPRPSRSRGARGSADVPRAASAARGSAATSVQSTSRSNGF